MVTIIEIKLVVMNYKINFLTRPRGMSTARLLVSPTVSVLLSSEVGL